MAVVVTTTTITPEMRDEIKRYGYKISHLVRIGLNCIKNNHLETVKKIDELKKENEKLAAENRQLKLLDKVSKKEICTAFIELIKYLQERNLIDENIVINNMKLLDWKEYCNKYI
ncbi:MAG: hypothetical protein RMJ67_06655 [Elusimicrobiota bacterium]|nr:hypothetical protein [Endomicrobiia bacterium]MDW8166174.1 hypothetical protein [Elusimicrobiota bacterium]